MMWDQWLVTALGGFLILFIIWFFWLKKGPATQALSIGDRQEAFIVVKGGYTPDTITLEKNRPVRLTFRRDETAHCSETVVLPDFDKSARLPTGKTVTVDFIPRQTGEFEFMCQMGMLRGKLIVK